MTGHLKENAAKNRDAQPGRKKMLQVTAQQGCTKQDLKMCTRAGSKSNYGIVA